jgi:hypothetical protein
MMDCLTFLLSRDDSDQSVETRRSNYAAWLATWLFEDPRVMDYFPHGLPVGPVYREVRGRVEALVFERDDPGLIGPGCTVSEDDSFKVTLWQAGSDEASPGWRRRSLAVSDIPVALATLESCRAWVQNHTRARCRGSHRP